MLGDGVGIVSHNRHPILPIKRHRQTGLAVKLTVFPKLMRK